MNINDMKYGGIRRETVDRIGRSAWTRQNK